LIGSFESLDSISDNHKRTLIEDNNIIHLEHTNNLEYYYPMMDILVFPTHREGFGNVSVEAQAMRTPVLTVDSTGSRDTVKHEETGLIVKRKNVFELYQAMKHLMEEPKVLERYKENSREFVEKNFSRNKIQQQLLSFYNQL
jgi:glycosyltransferase involved in cell wall biosynthesis